VTPRFEGKSTEVRYCRNAVAAAATDAFCQMQQSASQHYTIGSIAANVDGLLLGDLVAVGLAFGARHVQ